MKKKTVMTILAGTSLLLTQNSFAADVSFIPRAGVGYSNYNLTWLAEGSNLLDGYGCQTPGKCTIADLQGDLLLGTVGATLAYNRFYLDVFFQQSTEASDESSYKTYDSSNTVDFTRDQVVDWDFDVADYAVTAGVNIWSGLSVFGGWKGHEISMTGKEPTVTWNYDFTSSGWFLGLSYGWTILESNMLSVKAAYAWLDGEMDGGKQREDNTSYLIDTDGGTSSGANVGVTWKGFLTDSLNYDISADWYSYSFEDFEVSDSFNGGAFTSTDADLTIEEDAYTLRFTLSYLF
ncbi:hypothetical protein VT99_10424 [Candidatus Electrothrix marina]|uniref:Uncharacterized protein n=1 Tax=Candidatus Electrothrix marina TaxID=1859130 RepID=A0A3S3RVB0_9BACT|nr:hypothetical protein VT99_10424 [Candidatus Electrothrix marina]